MQKVFDKIIERLEKELKLADEVKDKCARENPLMFDNAKGYATGISNAVYIVKEVAEKFATDICDGRKEVSIDVLGLTVRPSNILKRSGVKTVEDLCKLTEAEVMNIRNMGRHSFAEIEEALKEQGLSFKKLGKEKTKGAWISIADGLPKVGEPLIVTVIDHINKEIYVKYPCYYKKSAYMNKYGFYWMYGDVEYQLLPDVSEVIAYMYLPEPYKPKGE